MVMRNVKYDDTTMCPREEAEEHLAGQNDPTTELF